MFESEFMRLAVQSAAAWRAYGVAYGAWLEGEISLQEREEVLHTAYAAMDRFCSAATPGPRRLIYETIMDSDAPF